jgi:hypothetical protein
LEIKVTNQWSNRQMGDRLGPAEKRVLPRWWFHDDGRRTRRPQTPAESGLIGPVTVKADECYALLQPMLKAGLVAADDFNLREVLALIHWSDPDDPEWSPSGYGQRGHWMRLFACTAMVRFAPIRRDLFEGECNTLAQLTSSAIELGQPVARAAASVLAWRFLAYPGADPDSAFLAFAILLLAAHLERGEDSGQWLKDLATWVEEEEARARHELSTWFSSLPSLE